MLHVWATRIKNAICVHLKYRRGFSAGEIISDQQLDGLPVDWDTLSMHNGRTLRGNRLPGLLGSDRLHIRVDSRHRNHLSIVPTSWKDRSKIPQLCSTSQIIETIVGYKHCFKHCCLTASRLLDRVKICSCYKYTHPQVNHKMLCDKS